MIGEGVERVYVGCSADSKYAHLTSVMLSSLDDNGSIPEATVIMADFGLTEADRSLIRRSAGHLGKTMVFFPVSPDSPEIIVLPSFTFPFPLMGRFVIPQLITHRASRLILLDSDMIVNRSLRPLFETNMRGFAVGAVHDSISWREHYGRPPSAHYFNAGMMLLDVDKFREQDIADRAMRRLASYGFPPMWLDQDALNDVLGDQWLSLDRRWNFFHAADYRSFSLTDYEAADIIHFSGPKPWEEPRHPAAGIFEQHVRNAEQKTLFRPSLVPSGSNRVFVASCYEVLLGRNLETTKVLCERAGLSPRESLACIIGSPEFQAAVVDPLEHNRALPSDRFRAAPTVAQRYWAIDRLPMLADTAARLEDARTWPELLRPLLEDRHFMAIAERDPLARSSARKAQHPSNEGN